MVELKNCVNCGRLFGYEGRYEKCKKCRDEQEDEFKKVKEFLWKNPGSSIEKIHKNTGVKKNLILRFANEGRLTVEGLDIGNELTCERCGKSISKGRFCLECQQVLIDGFKKDKKKRKKEKDNRKNTDEKMFLKDRIKKRKNEK